MWVGGKEYGLKRIWNALGGKHSEITSFGLYTCWHENGRKIQEKYYIRHKEHGRIDWDKEGNVIRVDFAAPAATPKQPINPIVRYSKTKRPNPT